MDFNSLVLKRMKMKLLNFEKTTKYFRGSLLLFRDFFLKDTTFRILYRCFFPTCKFFFLCYFSTMRVVQISKVIVLHSPCRLYPSPPPPHPPIKEFQKDEIHYISQIITELSKLNNKSQDHIYNLYNCRKMKITKTSQNVG